MCLFKIFDFTKNINALFKFCGIDIFRLKITYGLKKAIESYGEVLFQITNFSKTALV